MSDLTNGSMKKGDRKRAPSIYDIESATGIAVGRGYEDQVAAKGYQQQYIPQMPMALPEDAPSMEQLDQVIDNSLLPEESKEAAKKTLHHDLLAELEKGDEANIVVVRQQLAEITADLPALRGYLRSFIENYDGVSKTIRLLTRGLLE